MPSGQRFYPRPTHQIAVFSRPLLYLSTTHQIKYCLLKAFTPALLIKLPFAPDLYPALQLQVASSKVQFGRSLSIVVPLAGRDLSGLYPLWYSQQQGAIWPFSIHYVTSSRVRFGHFLSIEVLPAARCNLGGLDPLKHQQQGAIWLVSIH